MEAKHREQLAALEATESSYSTLESPKKYRAKGAATKEHKVREKADLSSAHTSSVFGGSVVTVVAQAVVSKGEGGGDGGGTMTRFRILDPAGWVSSANFDEVVEAEPVPPRTYDATKDQPASAATATAEPTADQPGSDLHPEEPSESDKKLRHTKSLFELRQEAEEASTGRASSVSDTSCVLT